MFTVKQLVFCYPHSKDTTLRGISFSIEKGEIFGFLGPSGAGKSTTQKILYKLLTGYQGEVLFCGKPLRDWDRSFYERIGVSFELPNNYLKLSARENLKFFAAFYPNTPADFMPVLEKVGLAADADKLVSDFSKGMKMRLNFARALLHNPDMYFFDEPTSGLDPVNANKIKDIIKELKAKGKTIFLTTHNMFDADQLCDRVALLHQGGIKAMDAPAELKLKYGEKNIKVITANSAMKEYIFPLENIGKNPDFLKIISQQEVIAMHSQEATLEEVFIKVTGQTLV